jgi:hypothetical protein
MIDVAFANIYSFASGARNQLQSKVFRDKLFSQDSKVADFPKKISRHDGLEHIRIKTNNQDCPDKISTSSIQQKTKVKAGLIHEFQKLFAPNSIMITYI